MSLAWATVVIAVLLTPGISFLFAIHGPDFIVGDTQFNPLGQLASVVLVSFLLHGCFCFFINTVANGALHWLPLIDYNGFFTILHAEVSPPGGEGSVEILLRRDIGRVLLYFISLNLCGYALGSLCGKLMVAGIYPFVRFSRHPWTNKLRLRTSFSFITVFSHPANDGRVEIFRGLLDNLFLKSDGTVSYMTLLHAESRVVSLPSPGSESDPTGGYIKGRGLDDDASTAECICNAGSGWLKRDELFFIAGSEISNFSIELRFMKPTSRKKMDQIMENARRTLRDAGISVDD